MVSQLTGALSHVLPIMIAVMSSKWVADSFGKEGIYAIWIALRRYPWVSSAEYRDGGRTSESYMTPIENVATIDETSTVGSLRMTYHLSGKRPLIHLQENLSVGHGFGGTQ